MVFLHSVRRMSSDSWTLGCPGSCNILFQRQMSYFLKKNQRLTCEEIMSYSDSRKHELPVTHFSPFIKWLRVLFFFPSHLKPLSQSRVMGFIGGGGNTTALPPSFCVLCWKHVIIYGILISYFFMLAWGFGFRMFRRTLAGGVVVMRGTWPWILVTWPWRRRSMIYCCAQRLWYLICREGHVLLWNVIDYITHYMLKIVF